MVTSTTSLSRRHTASATRVGPDVTTPHRVVVIGSGFGGLFGTQALKRADVDVTLIAPTTHHLFQPLLYQVATGILSEGEIAPATREVLARQQNARVLLGNVTHIDLAARTVTSTVLDRETRDAVRHACSSPRARASPTSATTSSRGTRRA